MTQLSDLLALAHLRQGDLGGRYGFQMARKALLRIAEHAGRDLADLPASDVLNAHAALQAAAGVKAKTFAEEHSYLKRLAALPPAPAGLTARMTRGEPTLADALAALDLQAEPGRWTAQRKALTTLIRLVSPDGTGGDVAAIETQVNRRLAALQHTDFGVQPSSFRTRKSQVRQAVRLVNLQARQSLRASMLSGEWRRRVEQAQAVKADPAQPRQARQAVGGALAKVWPLIAYAWRRSIPAAAVDDSVIAALLADARARGCADPQDIARNAVYGWETLQRHLPGWPRTVLHRVYASAGTARDYTVPESALPAELRAAWDAYVKRTFAAPEHGAGLAAAKAQLQAAAGRQEIVNPFRAAPPGSRARSAGPEAPAPQRRSGAANFATVFRIAAEVAVAELGRQPRTLEDLFVPEVLGEVLGWRYVRQQLRARDKGLDRPPAANGTLKSTVAIFKAIARDLGQPDALIAEIDTYYDQVHPDFLAWMPRDGVRKRRYQKKRMAPGRRRMLAAFDADGGLEKLLAWFRLPAALAHRVEQALARAGGDARKLSDAMLADAVTALIAAITRACPLRRENLGELRIAYSAEKALGANIHIPSDDKLTGRIHLWAGEIKKGTQDVAVHLTPLATRIARFYLAKIRPEIARRRGAAAGNPWLFPAAGMNHRALEVLTRHFVKSARLAGFRLDLHANRHLTAKIILDRDVTQMALIQQILGHQSVQTTEAYYADINSALAQRAFQAHLAAAERDVESSLLTALKRAA